MGLTCPIDIQLLLLPFELGDAEYTSLCSLEGVA